MELDIMEKKEKELKRENEELVRRWMEWKGREAEEMNQRAEMEGRNGRR